MTKPHPSGSAAGLFQPGVGALPVGNLSPVLGSRVPASHALTQRDERVPGCRSGAGARAAACALGSLLLLLPAAGTACPDHSHTWKGPERCVGGPALPALPYLMFSFLLSGNAGH